MQGESRSRPRGAGDAHGAAMQLGYFAHQRQAQPGAGRIGVLYARDAIKFLEDAIQVAGRNSRALIRHVDAHAASFGAHRLRDCSARGTVFDRVRDQVRHRARQQIRVGQDGGQIRIELPLQAHVLLAG